MNKIKNHFSYLNYIPKIMRYFIYSNIILDISLFIILLFQIEISDIMENIIFSLIPIYILIELIYIIELMNSDKK